MTRKFDAREMMRVAVQDEKGGIDMYESLAKRVRNDALAEAFRDLADQERHHEERFRQMLDGMDESSSIGSYPDEYVQYLEAIASEGGGHGIREQIARIENDHSLMSSISRR